MEDYDKIIESLAVRFIKARKIDIIQPINIKNHYGVENTIILLHQGNIHFEEHQRLHECDMLFLPAGRTINISCGDPSQVVSISNESFLGEQEQFLRTFATGGQKVSEHREYFSYVTFEAKIFDSVSFFTSLDIPPFVIQSSSKVASVIQAIIAEVSNAKAGTSRIVRLHTEQLVIEIIRYILDNQIFTEKLATNSTYFKDPRLIDIFTYIKNNLSGDLSNKVLAGVANVSEDYVGQYFKMLTGINPQDYIEYQRMEMAVNLLRTTKKSIRTIGGDVGYKDTAYFCRRFKIMFGISAGRMRRRESVKSA